MDGRSEALVRAALRVWTLIGALVLLTAAWWVLRAPLELVVPPLVIAAVVVYLLNPAVTGLQRAGVTRPLGTLLAYVVAIGAGWVLLALLGPLLVDQVRGLIDELPTIGAGIQTAVNDQLARFGLPADVRLDLQPEALADDAREILSTNQEQVLGLLRGAGSVVTWVFHLAIALTVGPIIAFYALSDLPRLRDGVRRLLPPDRRPEVVEVSTRITGIVGRYFRGQLLVATFVGAATAIGLALVGLPFWAVVGVTTGIVNVIPLVGPTAGAVFGVLIALTVGDGVQQALLVVLVMVAVQQVDNHLITPVVVSRSVAVHPITVILALIVAGSLGGIPAMVVAIPAVAVCKLVLLHVVVTRVPSMAHLTDDQDDAEVGRLRPGAVTDLAKELRRSFERRLAATGVAQRGPTDEELGARGQHPTADAVGTPGGTAGDGADSAAAGDGADSPAPDDGADEVSPPAGVARPS